MSLEHLIPSGPILVAGAGGFIGGHLVQALVRGGAERVRAVDLKPLDEWYQCPADAELISADLSELSVCRDVIDEIKTVYNLAADMGGMGFIENNKALCMLSVLINTHLLMSAREKTVDKFFFASSACVYAADKQRTPDVEPLREKDAYPAMPEDGYGWEKLFSERMCRHFQEDFGLQTRIARYHNIYGPHGTWTGGREKAPAAICRKIAEAIITNTDTITIWGDGMQTRSFTYITDCISGTLRLTASDICDPINVGSDELVTVNQLVDLVEDIAGVSFRRLHDLRAPQGVRGRSSDNTLIQSLLGWTPSVSLREGMEHTYSWVYDNVQRNIANLVV